MSIPEWLRRTSRVDVSCRHLWDMETPDRRKMITACRERSHSPVLKVASWGYTRLVMAVMGSGAWIPTDAELCQAFSASCWAWCFGFGTWSEAAPLLQLSRGHKWLVERVASQIRWTVDLNSSCSLFLKKSMGFGGHVRSAWGEKWGVTSNRFEKD